jgi:hypothetical protein
MRNKKRIHLLLKYIEKIWCHWPDLRLGQLIGNSAPNSDPYYLEDDQLLEQLKLTYESTYNAEKKKRKVKK